MLSCTLLIRQPFTPLKRYSPNRNSYEDTRGESVDNSHGERLMHDTRLRDMYETREHIPSQISENWASRPKNGA